MRSAARWPRSSRIPPGSPRRTAARSRSSSSRCRLSRLRGKNNRKILSTLDARSRPLMMAMAGGRSGRPEVGPSERRERVLARARSDNGLARFQRIALVLSGGAALGAYQAGAYAALENRGVRPNWIAGTAIGAINAAIVAGNLPHERSLRLRQFWHELSRRLP